MKENGFMLAKQEARMITDIDYADDIALLTNTATQAKYLLDSLECTVFMAVVIGIFHVFSSTSPRNIRVIVWEM